MKFDRATIAAYIDGELDLVTVKRIEKAVDEDVTLAREIESEKALRTQLTGHFGLVLDEALPERLTSLLTGNITAIDDYRSANSTRSYKASKMQWGAMAASLVVGLMIGGTALDRDAGLVQTDGKQLVASGALADALNTQLASTQGTNPEIRIGTSFAATGSGYCRTFESAALDGIACSNGSEWQLRQTLSGNGASEYRQASAGVLAEAAAAMMSGDPLDAASEKAAKDKGWRE